jgi:SOUL heme-binding protein
MPSKYTKETLPVPKNERVVIRDVPSQVVASISWR